MVQLGGRSTRWAHVATTCGTALLCVALASGTALGAPAPGTPSPPASADSADTAALASLVGLQAHVQDLYRQAEEATDRYNAAQEALAAQQVKANDVRAGIVWAQQNVDRMHDDMGRLARQQYASHGMDPMLSLMLSTDPGDFLREAPLYGHIAETQAETIDRAKKAEAQLQAMRKAADQQLAENKRLNQDAQKAKADIESRIKQAQDILSGLTPQQLAQLDQLEQQAAQAGQTQLATAGLLGHPDQLTTPAAQRAIAYALSKLGLPYVWGGTGPIGYDCSGLTSQAWLHAGVPIPRTSQEQWAQLPRVPLGQMRPGDLIVYYAGASHIAMYLGDGLIVQAPRPGRVITISPAGSMPILGVVRPDGGAGTVVAPAIPAVPHGAGGSYASPGSGGGAAAATPGTPGAPAHVPAATQPPAGTGPAGAPKPPATKPVTTKPTTSKPGPTPTSATPTSSKPASGGTSTSAKPPASSSGSPSTGTPSTGAGQSGSADPTGTESAGGGTQATDVSTDGAGSTATSP